MPYFRFADEHGIEAQISTLEERFEQLMECLSFLKPKEEIQFLNFLKSPFFNKDESLPGLYHRLRRQRGKMINGAQAIERLYGNATSLEEGIQSLIKSADKIIGLTDSFIAHFEIKNAPSDTSRQYIRAIKKSHETKIFSSAV